MLNEGLDPAERHSECAQSHVVEQRFTYAYVYVYRYLSVYAHIYINIYIYMFTYKCAHIHTSCIYTFMYI